VGKSTGKTYHREGKVAGAGVVISGATPIPWRCPVAENVITGRPLDESIFARAATAAMKAQRPLTLHFN
jgi:CO/xanthine dehydrogenase FAD-binding subunit